MYHVTYEMPHTIDGIDKDTLFSAICFAETVADEWIATKDECDWEEFKSKSDIWITDDDGNIVWTLEEYEPWMVETVIE